MAFSGKKFRAIRKRSCVTLEQLANAVGLGRSAIGHWETGRTIPSDDKLRTAAEVLDCNIDDFSEKSDDIIDQRRAVLRDADGRIKHETRFDSAGNPYREHWNLELNPATWSRMQECMKSDGFPMNDVDGYIQMVITEKFSQLRAMRHSPNPLTNDEWSGDKEASEEIARDKTLLAGSLGKRVSKPKREHIPDNQS